MKKVLSNIFTALVYIFMFAPLLIMVFFSFNESKSTAVFTGFSTYWYGELLNRSDVLESLQNTFVLAILSSVIATVLGTIASYGIYKLRSKRLKSAYMTVTNIPMMNPDIVTGVSLMLLFVFFGRLIGLSNSLGFFTLLIAHITFNVPYVILNIMPKLNIMDKNITDAALDLGCNERQAFFKTTLPAISSGIISGLLMAFTLSLDDFVISYYTTGSDFQTLPLKIFSMTKKTVKPDMYALSSIIFITVLVLLLIINILQIKGEKSIEKIN